MAKIGREINEPIDDAIDGVIENDKIIGSAVAFGDEQEALGIVNNNIIDTDGGKDKITGLALAFGDRPTTVGIQNNNTQGEDDEINTGDDRDKIFGSAISLGGETSKANGIINGDEAVIDMGAAADKLIGFAKARTSSTGELSDAERNDIEANGIFNGKGSIIDMGSGGDSIHGVVIAKAELDGGGENSLRTDINAIFNDIGGLIDTGEHADKIRGIATAHFKGEGRLNIADGFDNRGTVETGAGGDSIKGIARSVADRTEALAGGIDNGFGAFVVLGENFTGKPVIDTGDGDDRITGSGYAESGVTSIADGLENVGTMTTGEGHDKLEFKAVSVVSDSPTGRAIADGISQRVIPGGRALIDTGIGNDYINAHAEAVGEVLIANAEAIDNEFGGGDPGEIITGDGDDKLKLFAKAKTTNDNNNITKATALFQGNAGNVDTGDGNDKIYAKAEAHAIGGRAEAFGIFGGIINTDGGDDLIHAGAEANSADGESQAFGIFGSTIDTGAGKDRVMASSFGGGVNVDLGMDDDFVSGFAQKSLDADEGTDEIEAFLNGGEGIDEIKFEGFNKEDFSIEIGAGSNEATFSIDDTDMSTEQFEIFTFDNGSFDFNQL